MQISTRNPTKERLLDFLNQNQKAFNLSWISEQAGGISNFQQIVKGHRRLPDEYVTPLVRIMSQLGFVADPDAVPGPPAEVPERGLLFERFRDGMRIRGMELDYQRTREGYKAILRGREITDPKLTSNLIMVDRMAEGTLKLLSNHA